MTSFHSNWLQLQSFKGELRTCVDGGWHFWKLKTNNTDQAGLKKKVAQSLDCRVTSDLRKTFCSSGKIKLKKNF